MNEKIFIVYDLKKKTNAQRSSILQKLYGYRDRSNYGYVYERKGLLNEFDFEKSNRTFLQIKDKKKLAKVAEILNDLKVEFEVAKIQ